MVNDTANKLLVAFSFEVIIAGVGDDNAFQEASGLDVEIEFETVNEGGENEFAHKLPKAQKHPNFVVKRGVARKSGGLVKWCKEVFEGGFEQPIRPANIDVNLLDEKGKPAASWSLTRAWPVKWSIGGLDAAKNALAIETIEFAYNSIKRTL